MKLAEQVLAIAPISIDFAALILRFGANITKINFVKIFALR